MGDFTEVILRPRRGGGGRQAAQATRERVAAQPRPTTSWPYAVGFSQSVADAATGALSHPYMAAYAADWAANHPAPPSALDEFLNVPSRAVEGALSTYPAVLPDLGAMFEEGAAWRDQQATAGSGAARARELARRDQERLFAQQDLAQTLTDIEGQYRPDLERYGRRINTTERQAASDWAIFTSTMADVLPAYERAGLLTQEYHAKAVQALAADSAEARSKIGDEFASATGRIRALVLAVSGEAPEQVAALTEGIDEIQSFIEQGLDQSDQGNLALAAASRDLAYSAAQYGAATAKGELGREREKQAIQYEQAIGELVRDRRYARDTRDAALQSAREWATLRMAQQEAQWALSDVGYGGSGGQSQAGRVNFGAETPMDQASYVQYALSQYLDQDGTIPTNLREMAYGLITDYSNAGLSFQETLAAYQADADAGELDPDMAREYAMLKKYEDQLRSAWMVPPTAVRDWDQRISLGGTPFNNAIATYNHLRMRGYSDAEARVQAEIAAGNPNTTLTNWQQGITRSPAQRTQDFVQSGQFSEWLAQHGGKVWTR